MLKIDQLTKSFGTKKILNNISIAVQKGEIAVFLGSSGVGKSTLLRILNNLETINSGTISLNGTVLDLAAINTTHTVGMVFQHFNLFDHLTVEQNITLPLEKVLKKNTHDA
jgi:ABC-type polar amino acid transport system ATPase subunit